jgi:hypothetical protein
MPEQQTLPTQKFVDVKEIKNGIVYLKKGGLRKILIVSGVNFDLKSEMEQNLILSTFQNFINTLDFSIQFFIHSRRVNIGSYLERMNKRKDEEQNELLKVQIEEYVNFIKTFVEENAIISKSFFAVVPYESGPISTTGKGIMGLFGKKQSSAQKKAASDEERLNELERRVSQVVDGLSQIGLRVVPLEDEELVELFYNLYNPQLVEKKGLEITKTK